MSVDVFIWLFFAVLVFWHAIAGVLRVARDLLERNPVLFTLPSAKPLGYKIGKALCRLTRNS